MFVEECMTPLSHSFPVDTNIAETMRCTVPDYPGIIVVTQNHDMVGMITAQDLVRYYLAHREACTVVPLDAVMRPIQAPVNRHETVEDAVHILSAFRLDRSMVADRHGQLVGQVSLLALVRGLLDPELEARTGLGRNGLIGQMVRQH